VTDRGLPHIVDSCVLIDYTSINPQILSLAVQHIGPVIVTVQVLDEVEAFDKTRAVKAGLTVVDPDRDLIDSAVSDRGGLSACDKVIFTLAKHEGYICWTNDSKLKEICEEAGISASWGFEMMLVLCASGHLDRDTALSTARGIYQANRYIADKVLADFEAKIELI
jgi:predicted nucleic acid-binding protein